MSTARRKTTARVVYPESDGKPLAETGIHVEAIIVLVEVLRRHYEGNPLASVLVDMFLYWEEGNPNKRIAPDVFLTLGVPDDRLRRTFKVWEEGKAPDLIVEVTSKQTRKEDLEKKFALYRDVLRVREYILFDPGADYLKPPLQGYRLIDGEYRPIEPIAGRLPSEVLGVHLVRDGIYLRLYDPATGRLIPTAREEASEADAERQRVEIERQRVEIEKQRVEEALHRSEEVRRQGEDEIQRLRRELEELRRRQMPGTH